MNQVLCDMFPMEGSHFYFQGLATLWIFSAAVSAMQAPGSNSSRGYQWLYRFTHLLAANLDRAGLFDGATDSGMAAPERGQQGGTTKGEN